MVDFVAGFDVFSDVVSSEIVIALALLAAGFVSAKIIAVFLEKLNEQFKLVSVASLRSFAKMLELLIFIVFTIVALGVLGVAFAKDVLAKILELVPNMLIVILLLFLGYIFVNLIVDILKGFFLRLGRQDYLREFGVSANAINTVFVALKIFLYLVVLSIILNYYARPVPFFDSIVTGAVFVTLFFAGALISYSFKDYIANAFLSKYVEKNILKPGQRIRLGSEDGEVVSVTNHGATIELANGYNHIIPNSVLIKKEIVVKRVRSDIRKIEDYMKKFTPQLPSHCGPASASMLLEFFGYNVSQEELAKEAKTKVPGGTEPEDLIVAVKKVSNTEVKGHLVRFDEIYNLAEEVKAWIAEGALIILWYKKPVLFPEKNSQSGHYVLCVGVEGEEIIIMDPSSETAGVYLVNHSLLEEAMDEYDISRGYIVFTKKGTSAYWRLSEGLIYGDVSSYKSLSKSFERYLKRQLRQRSMINEIVSEHLSPIFKQENVKQLWKPDLTASKARQKLEKKASEEAKKNEKKEIKK